MNDKLAKISEWLNVAPSGVVHAPGGVVINVSSNGTTSIPAGSLEDIIFKRFEEMHLVMPESDASAGPALASPVTHNK